MLEQEREREREQLNGRGIKMILCSHCGFDDLTLISAFRYALGRRTYIVSHTVEALMNNWCQLSKIKQELIKKDVREALLEKTAGDKIDEDEWRRILIK